MPETKYEYYAALAERTSRQLTDSLDNWTAFLDTAARLYKYPYHEQLMIYAQRPDATACADFDTWSKTMRRYIRRGTKGIALIDHDSDIPKLKYVYDLADTGTRQTSRPVNLWKMGDEHLDTVFYMLDQNYSVTDISLTNIFEEISANLADEFWDNHRRDIIGIVENSFLEEYTDDTIGVRFREAVTVSATYTLMARCGMEPENPFTHEDFLPVFEFNTPDTIAALGTAVSEISEQILRDIEITIKIYEKERTQEHEERTDLHENGRIRVPEPDPAEPAVPDLGQVREDAPGISEKPPSDPVQSLDSLGETALSFDGDRGNGEPEIGADDGRVDEAEQRDGTDEIGEPDAVGTDDEQPEIAGGGSTSERADLQLSEPFRRGEQLSLFDDIPTEAEQIEYIDKAERVSHTPFAFSFSQDEIDTVLRFGSNERDNRMRIITEFMKDKSTEDHAAFLQELFHGCNGFKVDSREICAWYADDGIHLAQGRSARYVQFAQVISWTEAAERVGELLEQGRFASNVELLEAAGNERRLLAQQLCYMQRDIREDVRPNYFAESMFEGAFDDARDRIADMLADPFMRDTITDELARFAADYSADRSILRFNFYKPDEMVKNFRELALMNREYTSEIAETPQTEQFITEDEINEAFASHGSGVSGGKARIYEYFTADHNAKNKIAFLKDEYGWGGHTRALSGAVDSDEMHDGKGIRFKKANCYDVQISWQNAVKRIDDLMKKDRYLSQDEKNARKAHYDAEKVYSPIKAEHPDDIVLYQFGTAFEMYGEDAKKAGDILNRYVFERDLPGIGRVDMCNIDTSRLVESVEKLQDRYDVTVISLADNEWKTESYLKNPLDRTEQEIYDQYYPQIRDFVLEDVSYQNACKNADRDNALLEGESAVRRAAAEIQDIGFMRMYYDTPDFHDRLHRKILEETYPILMQNAQEQRIDAMLAFAEQAAKESAVEPYERFSVIETEDGFAVWDDIRDEIYVDDDGVSEEFGSEWQANEYLEQVRREVSAKESAEWNYREQVKQEALSDRTFAEEHLIPEETMFTIGNQPYMVDRVDLDSLTVHYQHIGVIVPEGEEIFHSAPVSVVRRYMEIDDIKIDLTDEQQTIVEAFETGGFLFNPFPNSEIRFDDAAGYPMTYKTWEDAYAAIDNAELRDFPGLREEVQRILHPDRPVNGMTAPDRFSIHEIPDEDGILGIWDAALDRFYAEGNQTLRITERENAEEYLSNILRIHGIVPKEPQEAEQLKITTKTVAVYPGEENRMPFDVVIQTIRAEETKEIPPENFRITDDDLGTGGAKTKFRMNMDAINTLKQIEAENRHATPDEQEVLSKYVGWGGLADAFDDSKDNWKSEYAELSAALTPDEYAAARSSTLNAHYTSPTVIKVIYEAVGNMGFTTGNVLEPSMGVGNFFGLLPQEMSGSKLYGVELDSITGRIAKQLYPNADITVAGFETTDRRDFFDLAVGNVPFGQYKVNDKAYNKLGFSIHDYFIAKTLDQVRPGGVIAFVTSRYTMDKQSSEVRKYIAERADLLGAIRLPNNAFKANAGTEVVSDILFLQKRDRPQVVEPDWVHLENNEDGFAINSYFVEHPEMILGRQSSESTQYGHQDFTVEPIEGANLADQLHEAVQHIHGQYQEAELHDLGDNESIDKTLPADPNVKNYSYTVVDGEVYYRENSIMVQPNLNATAKERVKGMVELRDCVHDLIGKQLYGADNAEISQAQERLNQLYDDFSAKHGLLNDRPNRAAFADDSSYYLLCSLEILDEEHHLKQKADMFTKRTIMPNTVVTSVDTAAEALAVSIAEKAKVDMAYMSELTGKSADELAADLRGVIFQIPEPAKSDGSVRYVTADEYLSGNVREKLRVAEAFAADNPAFAVNVEALTAAQPKKLEAHEIDVRLGATWIDKAYIQQFMLELLNPPFYSRRKISVNYSEFTAEWNISGKSVDSGNINSFHVYGTDRASAYKILEDTLNLRDIRIYDTVTDADGKERRVLNSKETTLAQQKQQAIKDAFQDWIWKDPDRRHTLVERYNELFNSSRPREYNGEHIRFNGMNPEISLREHQKNAVAHILYGGNTLLAHEVGAGKTFEMVAAAMESKRLGLCNKPLFAVPNHLTEQWASEFLRLYPSANILVTTKKDFEPANRKKFCARIATGNYDAVIMGHSQFEKIPMSKERQEQLLQDQIAEITDGIAELQASNAERFTIKQLERTKKSLEVRLSKLQDNTRKDDVITFEQLGVDRLYVDEAHSYKNLFLYTKMRNVAGLSTTDAQKSSDMFMKCRYLDEITGSKGVIFATGTPVSNSMVELYTMMRYLQHDTLEKKHLNHFDAWASTFGETTTAIELAPEGTGYRARTRFAKFFNLPELMNLFKEAADIKTADQLHLPTPTPIYHNVVAQPTEIQQEMMKALSERASKVHSGTIDPSVDNMLKITSDGRKLGLDQRIINPDLPDSPESKVNLCVDNIHKIWTDTRSEKLTQLVFCDLSTPKSKTSDKISDKAVNAEVHGIAEAIDSDIPDEKPFTVYEDIRDKLIVRGVPASEIAFIHDADTEVKKKELFGKVRSGQVRVLLGSTSKMGAGTNCQDRLVALHDLDCPWRPGDLEQRKGRIVRQGNMNPEVHIYRYVTEKSFDSYLWQTVENKQKFISQIMTSKSPVRTCDDVDETALSYAEVKALCAGDDRIREKMNLDVDVAKLRVLKADHQSKQHRLEDDIQIRYPAKIEAAETAIAGFKKDRTTVESHPHPTDGFAGMELKGSHYTEKDTAGEALLAVMKEAQGLEPLKIGSYRGFQLSLTLEDFGRQYILTLKGEMSHKVELGKDVRGNLIRIDNALGNIPGRIQAAEVQLASIREQLETAKAEVGKPFPQEEELKTKNARLVELNAELDIEKQTSMAPAEDAPEQTEKKPSILARLHNTPAVPKPQLPEKEKSQTRDTSSCL